MTNDERHTSAACVHINYSLHIHYVRVYDSFLSWPKSIHFFTQCAIQRKHSIQSLEKALDLTGQCNRNSPRSIVSSWLWRWIPTQPVHCNCSSDTCCDSSQTEIGSSLVTALCSSLPSHLLTHAVKQQFEPTPTRYGSQVRINASW